VKVLGLDISTHTGYAIVQDAQLLDSGVYHVELSRMPVPLLGAYAVCEEFAFMAEAQILGSFIAALLDNDGPFDAVAIEQTNLGRSRTDQKRLEFLHFGVLAALLEAGLPHLVQYIDSSRWRSFLQIRLNKDQRAHNKSVRAKKARGKITNKHLAVAWANSTYGKSLLLKDNDQADAIAIATCCYRWLTEKKPAATFEKAFR
jgi:hypothetical protein